MNNSKKPSGPPPALPSGRGWRGAILLFLTLPFRRDRALILALHRILGMWPREVHLYKTALLHKSSSVKEPTGIYQNNERLEFLGDAVLDAVVGDIVYRRFPAKHEGFLTNARSKLVRRSTLGQLAKDIGLDRLITSRSRSHVHNSYMAGNAFEALVGALYLDRGYDACMLFMKKRILDALVDVDKVAYKETNFKSKLIEWAQKNHIRLEYRIKGQDVEQDSTPTFTSAAVLEGVECGEAKGYSKKESQQNAAKVALKALHKDRDKVMLILDLRDQRLEKEEIGEP